MKLARNLAPKSALEDAIARGFQTDTPQKLIDEINAVDVPFSAEQHKSWADARQTLIGDPNYQTFREHPFFPQGSHYFELTPSKAYYINSNFNLFEGQRQPTERRVAKIGMAGVTGTWHGNKIVLACLGEDYLCADGRTVRTLLLNGGNTIASSMKYGLTLDYNQLMFIYCPTIESATHAYHQIDPKESTRTATEINKAILAGATAEYKSHWIGTDGKLRSGVYHNVKTACVVSETGPSYRSRKMSEPEKEKIMHTKYEAESLWMLDYIFNDKDTPKYMKHVVGVLAPIMATCIAWGEDCEAFWDDVKLGFRATPNNRMNGATKYMTPQHALVQYLTSAGREDERTMYGKVMSAANAWASGKHRYSFGGHTKMDENGVKKQVWDKVPIPFDDFCPNSKCLPVSGE